MNQEKKKNNRHRPRHYHNRGKKLAREENIDKKVLDSAQSIASQEIEPLPFSDLSAPKAPVEDVPLPEGYDFDDDSILFGVKPPKEQIEGGENMTAVIGIRFKKTGKIYYFAAGPHKAKRGDCAIVETARGLEFGEVWLSNRFVSNDEIVPPLRPIVRVATEADMAHNEENHQKEKDALRICNQKILDHKLDMKLVDAQYTFDNSKLLFYFTSAGRVDFRELVKDLASVFRTRIELRQIGIRDEAKLIGGLGACGRSLCCSSFLSNFGQVSIKMAKEQNLSLNSSKISGNCGRLMCCLRYEHKTYEEELKLTPPVDSVVKTPDGMGTVCEVSPLTGFIKVKLKDSDPPIPKPYHRDSVKVLSHPGRNEQDENEEQNEE